MYRGNDEEWFYQEPVRKGTGAGEERECQSSVNEETENNKQVKFDKEYYINELLPHYLLILKPYGFDARTIGKMTLYDLKPYSIAFEKEMEIKAKEREYNAWLVGAYTRIAVSTSTIGNSSLFTKKANEYPKQPYGQKHDNKKNLSVEDSEALAVFEMNKFIRDMELQGLPQAPA